MKYLPWLFLVVLAGGYLYADMDDAPATEPRMDIPAEQEVPFGTYVPDASGGVYIDSTDGLWYLRGSRLHKVEGIDFVMDVIPTADGAAYAVGVGQAWRLDGAVATPVTRAKGDFVPVATPPTNEQTLFALWQYERRQTGDDEIDNRPLLGPDPAEDPN